MREPASMPLRQTSEWSVGEVFRCLSVRVAQGPGNRSSWYDARKIFIEWASVRKENNTGRFRKSVLLGLGSALAIAGILTAWPRLIFSQGPDLRADLVAILGPLRPSQGLLAGFGYAPYEKSTGRVNSAMLEQVRLMLQRLDRSRVATRSAEALATLAVAELVDHDLDGAIRRLTQAVHWNRDDAHLWSDLSAVYLARAEAQEQPYDVLESLDAALRAVEIQPDLREARFNLALTLEQFSLDVQALGAWNEYLRLDPDSPWAREAEEHLRSLSLAAVRVDWDTGALETACLSGDQEAAALLVARFPQPVRLYAEKQLLADWARAEARGAEGGGVAAPGDDSLCWCGSGAVQPRLDGSRRRGGH